MLEPRLLWSFRKRRKAETVCPAAFGRRRGVRLLAGGSDSFLFWHEPFVPQEGTLQKRAADPGAGEQQTGSGCDYSHNLSRFDICTENIAAVYFPHSRAYRLQTGDCDRAGGLRPVGRGEAFRFAVLQGREIVRRFKFEPEADAVAGVEDAVRTSVQFHNGTDDG